MQFPLVTFALIAIARSATGFASDGKDTIKIRKYGTNRPKFVENECNKPGVVCLFETTRPSRAFVKHTSVIYQDTVQKDEKVIAFKGKAQIAKTLVAIHPGTELKMQCNTHDYIVFKYQPDGLLKSMKTGGKAKAEWQQGTFKATGSIKVDPKSHHLVNFQCK